MGSNKNTLIVISDLHLSAGFSEDTKCYSREEDFFFDNEFKRFLEYLEKENPGKNHLIINGDMFDFLQVNGDLAYKYKKDCKIEVDEKECIYGLGTEPQKTVFKLRRIREGHRVFFKALGDFLSKGNDLSIISGNHDIELCWEEVKKELKEIICNSSAAKLQSIKDRIKFHPWFYYEKENKIYIEHGNQYDNLNSFKFILKPVIPPQNNKILLPFGSFFVRYFLNMIEDFNPFADNIKPSSKYMQWAFKNHPLKSLKLPWHYIPAMFKAFFKSRGLSKADEEKLKNEIEHELARISNETGLSLDTIKSLNNKLIPPMTENKFAFIIHSTFFGTIILFLLILAAGLALKYLFNFPIWSLFSALSAILLPIIRWLLSKSMKDKTINIIKEIKNEILKDVKIITTGHTHDPVIKKIGDYCWYYNTSTWTTVFSEEERLIREEKQFALLKIKLTANGPDAQLMRWNDIRGKCEELILFEDFKKKYKCSDRNA